MEYILKIFRKINSRKFQKAKLEFATCWQLFTQHLHFVRYSESSRDGLKYIIVSPLVIWKYYAILQASQVVPVVNTSAASAGDVRGPWVEKIPWKRTREPTPVFLPGESRGQSSLEGQGLHRVSRVRRDWSDSMHAHIHTQPLYMRLEHPWILVSMNLP